MTLLPGGPWLDLSKAAFFTGIPSEIHFSPCDNDTYYGYFPRLVNCYFYYFNVYIISQCF